MIEIILMLIGLAFPNNNTNTSTSDNNQNLGIVTLSAGGEASVDTGGEDGIIPPPKK